MNFEQPMFEDVPRQHPRVYRQVVADYWRSALCVGSLALVAGVIRGIALLHEEISSLVNSASMLGSFIAAAVLLVLWHRMSFRFGLISVFRVVYPLLTAGISSHAVLWLGVSERLRGGRLHGLFPCADAHDDAVRPGLPRSWYQSCVHLRVLWGYRLYFAKRRLPFWLGERIDGARGLPVVVFRGAYL